MKVVEAQRAPKRVLDAKNAIPPPELANPLDAQTISRCSVINSMQQKILSQNRKYRK